MSTKPARPQKGAAGSDKATVRSKKSVSAGSKSAARPATGGHARAEGRAPTFHSVAPVAARIEQLQQVLGEILQWQFPADHALSHWMRARPKLGSRDRAEITETVFNVLRNLRRYRNLAESGTGPSARRLAILGLDAMLSNEALDAVLEPAEKEWLQHIRRVDI